MPRSVLHVIVSAFLFCSVFTASSQPPGMELSPTPPKQALPNSLPPQQAWLPPSPGHLPLSQGYLPGQNGVQLFYRVVGSGKDTVLFLHGGPTGMEAGALDLEPLAEKGYTFISFDQRGGGRSELIRDSAQLDIYNYAMDVDAVRKFFHIRKLSLIGYAWGAGVALLYANTFPDNVKNIVFISPINPTTEYRHKQIVIVDSILSIDQKTVLQKLRKQWLSPDTKDLGSVWTEQDSIVLTAAYLTDPSHYHSRGSYRGYSAAALRNTDIVLTYAPLSLGNPYDLRPFMQHINVPTLVIDGAQSKVALDATKEYALAIKKAKLALIPNAGHMVWLDDPLAVENEIDRFYRNLPK